MSDIEWGPWIEHDGKGCPLAKGVLVHLVLEDGDEWIGLVGTSTEPSRHGLPPIYDEPTAKDQSWTGNPDFIQVIRYRIRKPRALQTLIEIAADPAPLPEGVDA